MLFLKTYKGPYNSAAIFDLLKENGCSYMSANALGGGNYEVSFKHEGKNYSIQVFKDDLKIYEKESK